MRGGFVDSSLVSQVIVAGATLTASLGGFLLAGRNERRRDHRALTAEMELRLMERGGQRESASHEFQLETLLALQDAVQLMARLTGRTLHFDQMQARTGQTTQLPDSLSDDALANTVEVNRLAARVLDVGVRDAVAAFSELSARLSTLPVALSTASNVDVDAQYLLRRSELTEGYATMTAVLGERIRYEISWRPDSQGA